VLDFSSAHEQRWEQRAERWSIQVRGALQGVGFRDFVYSLATRLHLNGSVVSRSGAVAIEVEGNHTLLGDFLEEMWIGAPTQGRIDQVSCHAGPVRGTSSFQIVSGD
jgi:hydrogenase maturation protein HypF